MGFPMPCRLLFLLCLASFFGCLAQGQVQRCGREFGGRLCQTGLCCSQWGFCGTTPAYCDNGCQSQCNVERCGAQGGSRLCRNNRCCSEFGYCGSTPEYCDNGCQSQCTVERCGRQGGGRLCRNNRCCSTHGYCGSTNAFCGSGCQSQCNRGVVSNITSTQFDQFLNISSSQFDEILKHRNDMACPGNNLYTYDAFLAAAHSFSGFAMTGDSDTRKREIAAFFAQTSTTGGCGDEPTISFKTALSIWMTPQSSKPSCHDVITGKWMASAAERGPGFGVITNFTSGGVECGKGSNPHVADRIGLFYKIYCDIMEVSYGEPLGGLDF